MRYTDADIDWIAAVSCKDAADTVADRHEQGHEFYALERYLSCLCTLALHDFAIRHEVNPSVIANDNESGEDR